MRWLSGLNWQFHGWGYRYYGNSSCGGGSKTRFWAVSPPMFRWRLLWKHDKYNILSNTFCFTSVRPETSPVCCEIIAMLLARGNCNSHIDRDSRFIWDATCHDFRETLRTNSAPYFLPPISLLLSDLLLEFKKTLIFILSVSNKTGTNGSWQNMFSVTAEKLLDWCPWNAECD